MFGQLIQFYSIICFEQARQHSFVPFLLLFIKFFRDEKEKYKKDALTDKLTQAFLQLQQLEQYSQNHRQRMKQLSWAFFYQEYR